MLCAAPYLNWLSKFLRSPAAVNLKKFLCHLPLKTSAWHPLASGWLLCWLGAILSLVRFPTHTSQHQICRLANCVLKCKLCTHIKIPESPNLNSPESFQIIKNMKYSKKLAAKLMWLLFSWTQCSGSHKSWIMDPRKAINAQKNRPEHLYITKQTNRKKTAQQYLI